MYFDTYIKVLSILLVLFSVSNVNAQYDTEHYIAPTGFTFYNETHRIYITTLEDDVSVRFYVPTDFYSNSNPIEVFQIINGDGIRKDVVTVSKGTPIEVAIPNNQNISILGKGGIVRVVQPILTWGRSRVNESGNVSRGEGLIVIASAPVSVTIANLSGSRFIQTLSNPTINGNSSLTSKGKLALGKKFHVLNYEGLSYRLGFNTVGESPVNYSFLATEDNTQIKFNGQVIGTLNKGEYIIYNITNLSRNFNLTLSLGSVITSTNPVSMTISSKNDYPPGSFCADAYADQMIPDKLAGTEYIAIRGKGYSTVTNITFERINIVAINDNTTVVINRNGTESRHILAANESYTTNVGNNNERNGPYTTSYIKSDKPILVIQASGQGCEQGLTVLPPLSCTGSNHIETKALPDLITANSYYPFDAYVLVKCGTTPPTLNGVPLTNPSNVLGNDSWQLYRFNNSNLGDSDNIIVDNSDALMHVGMLQIGGLFTAYAYLSGFSKAGIIEIEYETPSNTNIIEEGCSEAKIIFKRIRQCGLQDIKFTFSGNATPGVDYESPAIQNNGIISFTANEIRKEVPIIALIDNEIEGEEFIDISFALDTDCDGITEELTSKLILRESAPMSFKSKDYTINCIDDTCPTANKTLVLESELFGGFPPYTVTWEDGTVEKISNSPYITSFLVSKNQNYPTINGDKIYSYRAVDKCGSSINGQVKITKEAPPTMSYTTPDYIVGCIDLYCNTDNEVITATAVVKGGTPPYVVMWEDGTEQVLTASPFNVQLNIYKDKFINKMNSGEGNSNAQQKYNFTVTDNCCINLNGNVTIYNQCGYCAPNVFTPNGDGFNDTFVVQNSDQYENTTVIIHTRWGEVVYSSDNYKNNWDAKDVISGTYYYEIIPDDTSILLRKDAKVYNRKINGMIDIVR